ncbi:hypothetical protein F4803DRAFT_203976 [Xylaria telfairii]|nr:hypothetical protein F4803DRAFT_203976 [Xylaria telfairii]
MLVLVLLSIVLESWLLQFGEASRLWIWRRDTDLPSPVEYSTVGSRTPLYGLNAGTNCCACMYAHKGRILIHTLDRLLCPVRTISWIPRFSKRLRANVKTTMDRAGRFTRGRGRLCSRKIRRSLAGCPSYP